MSMAIKYGLQKKARMAEGDDTACQEHGTPNCDVCMAEGGFIDTEEKEHREYGGVHAPAGGRGSGSSDMGTDVKHGNRIAAKMSAKRHLNTLKSDKTDRKYLAEGGEVSDDDDDLVSRIMRKRGTEPTADFEEADYDAEDEMDPGTKADYTGGNSGDELGNDEMDENDQDLVRRIMRSRAKRDSNPRPA